MKIVKTHALRPLLMATLIASSLPGFANDSTLANKSSEIGTVQAVIESFVVQNAHPSAQALHSLSGKVLATKISHFFHKDGQLSISGIYGLHPICKENFNISHKEKIASIYSA